MKDAFSLLFIAITNFVFLSETLQYESCITPILEDGECINIVNCEPLRKMLVRKPITNQARTFLRQSHCDTIKGKHFVCCALGDLDSSRSTRELNNVSDSSTGRANLFTQVKTFNSKSGICGKSAKYLENRIVGGEETIIGEFPWMAALLYEKSNDGSQTYGCGGTIITIKHVLTAAHCVLKDLIPQSYFLKSVIIGDWDKTTNPDCQILDGENICAQNSFEAKIDKILTHEYYNPSSVSKQNDIALVKLKETLKFNDFVAPICMDDKILTGVDQATVTIIGFGRTETTKSSDILLKTEVDLVPNSQCIKKYRTQGRPIFDTQICAIRYGSDSCNGDSGSSMMLQTSENPLHWHLVGIVSYGPAKCGSTDFPGIYTRVDKFTAWIQNKIKL